MSLHDKLQYLDIYIFFPLQVFLTIGEGRANIWWEEVKVFHQFKPFNHIDKEVYKI